MNVLGIDPGTRSMGWSLLLSAPRQRGYKPCAEYLAKGTIAATEQAVEDLVRALERLSERKVDRLVLEEVSGTLFPHKGTKHGLAAAGNLFATAKVGARVEAHMRAKGLAVATMPARRSRSLVGGKANASDATIKRAVLFLVKGWPKLSNVHERDAAVVALASIYLDG